MAKYTPLMRLRKARKPKTNAANPGTSNPSSKVSGRLLKRLPKKRQLLNPVPNHEVGQRATVHTFRPRLEQHVHPNGVAA